MSACCAKTVLAAAGAAADDGRAEKQIFKVDDPISGNSCQTQKANPAKTVVKGGAAAEIW